MKKTGKVLNSLEDYILAAMLMVMTILAFINVIMRYVLLSSLPWCSATRFLRNSDRIIEKK